MTARSNKAETTKARQGTQEGLRVSEIRYRRLFETARDGILILDATTRKITDVNPFMVELLGYSREELLGKELFEIGLLKDAEASAEAFRALQDNGYIRYEDLPLQTKWGKRREVEFISNVYAENDHQVIQCNIRDITGRKETERELGRLMVLEQAARASAEAANHTKDEFLAMVSHELRTPLTVVLGWSGMLRNKSLDEATKAHGLEIIERNVKLQAQLIQDILDASSIAAGKLRLYLEPVCLASVISHVIDSSRMAADAKSIDISASLDLDVGLVEGDPNRLQQVMSNLLTNAIKFTPQSGRIEVRLKRVNSHAQFTVSDNGKGISGDFLPFVFESFRQANSNSTRKYNGLGLGLSIVRNIVEMHGGTVQAQSHGERQGASFTVSIPLMLSHSAEKAAPNDAGRPLKK